MIVSNFDLLEYQKRVIADLSAENKALKDQIEVLNNQHIKIQYHNEELTVKEICERLEKSEKAKHSLIAFLNGSCMACVKRYDCNTRRGSHKWCWKFDYFLIGED